MYDVFISYKSEERKEAIQVRDFLQANGLKCWMDQDQIKVGQDYKKEIEKYIPQCHAIIILISYISQKSKEVKKLQVALDLEMSFATVKKVEKMTGRKYNWRNLKKYCQDAGLGWNKAFDANYGSVNSYPIEAWKNVYGIEI